MVAGIDELENLDASEKHARRLNAKEIKTPKHGEHFTCPIADGTVKLSGGDQDLRTSTLIRDHPIRGEDHQDFLAEAEGAPPTHFLDSLPNAGEARNDLWSISGDFIYRHHVEPRVKPYTSREETFSIPLKYIDVSRGTHATLDLGKSHR